MKSDCTYCAHLAARMATTEVGAKAANLGKALSLGLRVPPAFVVTRGALALFLEETGLIARVRKLLERCDARDQTARKQLFDELCADVGSAPIPATIKKEVSVQAEELLKSAPAGLAVRSSGICEDTEKASFAGVYESFLCLSSMETIWNGIRRCWCSSWTPSAIDYARKMGIVPEPDQMAVIVQEVVPADAAGVIFTADTLTGNPWRFVLSSTFGLAGGLMAGTAPADRFVLEWDTGDILERQIVSKPAMLVPAQSGVESIQLSSEKRKTASLSDSMIQRLAKLALDSDRRFEMRVDVEWAIVGEDIFLIQVRPITALPEFFPHNLSGPDTELSWIKVGLQCPFYRDIWESEMLTRYQLEEVCLGNIKYEVGNPEYRERDFFGYRYKTKRRWKTRTDADALERWLDMNEVKLRQQWMEKKREMEKTSHLALAAQTTEKRLGDLIPDLLLILTLQTDHQSIIVHGPPQFMGFICEDEFLKPLIEKIAPHFVTENLLQGIPSYSYERTEAAQDLGQSTDEDVVKAAFMEQPLHRIIPYLLAHHPECQFLKDYEAYCWRYGVFPHTWLSRPPAWSTAEVADAKQQLLIIRRALMGGGRDIRRHFDQCVRKREASEAEIRGVIQHKHPELLSRFNKLLDWTQFWVPVLDDRTWSHLPYYTLLELIWQVSVRLQRAGLIDRLEDMYLFSPEELERIGKTDRGGKDICIYRDLYVERKREYEGSLRLTPPEFIGAYVQPSSGPETPQHVSDVVDIRTAEQGEVLIGQGFTPGHVTGVARKVENLKDTTLLDSLNKNDILVCVEGAFDNQTDWLSLLMIVRGVVMVENSADSHISQIARECGIPVINLPKSGPASIPDNTQIILDGKAGTVTILGV